MSFKQLYPYQEKYLEGMPSRHIMSAALGTGKSPLSIVHYIRNAYPQPLLILAPASKVRAGDWTRELEEVFTAHNLALPEYQVLSYDKFAYNPSNDAFRKGIASFLEEEKKAIQQTVEEYQKICPLNS